MRRGFALLIVLGACGRVAFEDTTLAGDGGGMGGGGDAGDGGGSSSGDPCAAGDSTCRVSCLATDPDCTTTCGDSVCVGNAGEFCTNCVDCNTTAAVCGNGQCDPLEDSDLCYADCGPTPWMWQAAEADMLNTLNTRRAAGITCPGGGGPIVSADVSRNDALTLGAREWAWELRYQLLPSGDSCNGRTAYNRIEASGASGAYAFYVLVNNDTPAQVVDGLLADNSACPELLAGKYSQAGIGVVTLNGFTAYVLFLD